MFEHLLSHAIDVKHAKISPGLWKVSEKINGVRRFFVKQNGVVRCYQIDGKIENRLDHITSYIQQEGFKSNHIYDCQIVDRKTFLEEKDAIFLSARSSTILNERSADKNRLAAICFETFSIKDDGKTACERSKELDSCLDSNDILTDPIVKVPSYGIVKVERKDEIPSDLHRFFIEVVRAGGEGLVLSKCDERHISGKTDSLIKMKREQVFIGTVVDFIKAGQKGIAALIVTTPVTNIPITIALGFSKQERLYFARMPLEKLIGSRIEIEAFGISLLKGGGIALNTPIYKRRIT